MSPGEASPREGLTSSILVHHAQPLCLILPLKGIEIQDTEGGERKDGEDVMRPLPASLPQPGSPHAGGWGAILNQVSARIKRQQKSTWQNQRGSGYEVRWGQDEPSTS